MQLARIMLPVQLRVDMERIAQTAFVLADRFGAEVEGIYAFTPPAEQIRLYYEAAAPALLEALRAEAEQRSEAAKKKAKDLFDKATKPYFGISSRFHSVEGNVPDCIARYGRLADLTVIGTVGSDEADPWLDTRDAAILNTGRPVIVAPDAPVSTDLGKTVVVAWKDSVEAARAVAAAKPFIERAETVHLVSAGSEAVEMDALKEVQAYLALHAKDVKATIIGANSLNIAELLLEEASRHADALLVMGAYSHWRWREWAFGGVTEFVLHEAKMPVLMTH